jgi:hypothetical protein
MAALEAEKVTAERAVPEIEHESVEPVPLPTPEETLKLAFDLDARLRGDTLRGREELRELFKDGLITLLPQAAGYYVARSEVPLVLITRPPPEGGSTRRLVARGRNRALARSVRPHAESRSEGGVRVFRELERHVRDARGRIHRSAHWIGLPAGRPGRWGACR